MFRRILIGILVLIIILIIFFLNRTSLTPFRIISFEQSIEDIYTLNTLFFESSKSAIFYEVRVFDETNQLLKIYKTEDNYLTIDNLPVDIGTKLYFRVIAYDNHGISRSSSNKLYYTWNMPTIGSDSKYIDMGTDVTVNVKGVSDSTSYSLMVMKDEEKIYINKIDSDKIIIPSSLIGNYKGYLKFYLLQDNYNVSVSSFEVGVGIDEITDMKISYPHNKEKLKWKDFYLVINGGDNAYYYTLSVKNWIGQYVIYEQKFNNKEVLIKASDFNTNINYEVIIRAYNKLNAQFIKEVITTFSFLPKKKALPVISTVKNGEVRIGERIRLVSPDNINIYYTIDGSDPNINSLKYEEPIIIKKDMIIKAIAVNDNYYTSNVVTYNYKAVERLPVVYLSPSTQIQNKGVVRAGYTSEREMMNKVADVIERKLKEANVIVYRNTQDLKLSEVSKISRGLNVDLHLAIHSNAMTSGASKESRVRGVLTFVYDNTSPVLELAYVIENGLKSVYNGPKSNCYIVYSRYFERDLYELKPSNFQNSILLEIGFHDNYDDALWIVSNIEKIGGAVADSIVNYFNNNLD